MNNKEQKVQPTSVSGNSTKPNVIRRLSSYEKLKAENEKLRNDIYNIVRNMDKMEGIITKARYELQYKMSDAVFFEDAIKPNQQFNGILGCMSNSAKHNVRR